MYDTPNLAATQTRKVGPDRYEAYHGTDDELIVTFEQYPIYLEAQSKIEGRKLYREEPHIRIQFPADRTREIFRMVRNDWDGAGPPDAERFPRQWAAFQNQGVAGQMGTLLAEWPMVNKAQVLELKAMNVSTVEQLAAVPDTTLHNLGMGGRELRDKAKAWLDKSKDDSTITSLMARLEALEAENRAYRNLEGLGEDVAGQAEARRETFTRTRKPRVQKRRKAA
jgi:hypothetical protein